MLAVGQRWGFVVTDSRGVAPGYDVEWPSAEYVHFVIGQFRIGLAATWSVHSND
ncbi:hypothetical protein Mal52_40340 [Symmachiella dynata]|uniref:Uncharacterized protein n=1 Tax=Symmachiella dynata TaxID=2527995 RepID=A0A517ZSV9_9PLAN|nr:hypothetical protein Mal52_40340 [Symmachiella dynata]